MGTYFPPLNLTLDADERAVKRAYAALLKVTRPEDDPVAFQALVDARDRALDWVRRREERVDLSTLGDALRASPEPTEPEVRDAAPETIAPEVQPAEPVVTDEVSDEDAERVLREILAMWRITPRRRLCRCRRLIRRLAFSTGTPGSVPLPAIAATSFYRPST